MGSTRARPLRGEHHRLLVLLAIARAIHASVRLDRVFAAMAGCIRRALRVDHAHLALAGEDGVVGVRASGLEPVDDLAPGTRLPLDGSAAGACLRGPAPITSDALGPDAAHVEDARLGAAGYRVRATTPLRLRGRVVGALTLAARRADAIGASDLRFIDALGEQLSAAVANAHAWERVEALTTSLRQQNQRLRAALETAITPESEPIGSSPAWRAVLELVDRAAASDATVLITGETGTGKEVVAHALHRRSARRDRPFHAVNCAALPPALIASELFGHERGAFTGALRTKPGRFELAATGTLFLDEVTEMPTDLQAQLLRVLQERQVWRLGGDAAIPVDVRVVAATNRDPAAALAGGQLRDDLYYRLNVVRVHVPALRDRPDDLEPLIRAFVDRAARRAGRTITRISRRSLAWARRYHWPGNVRELQNLVERAVVLTEGPEFSFVETGVHTTAAAEDPTLAAAIRAHIEQTLRVTRGRIYGVGGAAERLGLKPSTLQSKCRKLGIDRAAFERS